MGGQPVCEGDKHSVCKSWIGHGDFKSFSVDSGGPEALHKKSSPACERAGQKRNAL